MSGDPGSKSNPVSSPTAVRNSATESEDHDRELVGS